MVLFRGAVFASVLLAYWQLQHLFERRHVLPLDRVQDFDEEAFFRNPHGLLIHFRPLGKAVAEPKGVVLLLHGYGEWSEYYVNVSLSLNGGLFPASLFTSANRVPRPRLCHVRHGPRGPRPFRG